MYFFLPHSLFTVIRHKLAACAGDDIKGPKCPNPFSDIFNKANPSHPLSHGATAAVL